MVCGPMTVHLNLQRESKAGPSNGSSTKTSWKIPKMKNDLMLLSRGNLAFSLGFVNMKTKIELHYKIFILFNAVIKIIRTVL